MTKKLFKNKLLSVILTVMLSLLALQNVQAQCTFGVPATAPNRTPLVPAIGYLFFAQSFTPSCTAKINTITFNFDATCSDFRNYTQSGVFLKIKNAITGEVIGEGIFANGFNFTNQIYPNSTLVADFSCSNSTLISGTSYVWEFQITDSIDSHFGLSGGVNFGNTTAGTTYAGGDMYSDGDIDSGSDFKGWSVAMATTATTTNAIIPNITTASACGSYTWPANATTYTASGTYPSSPTCAYQELHLTITPPAGQTQATAIEVNSSDYTTTGNNLASNCFINAVGDLGREVWYKVNRQICKGGLSANTCTGTDFDSTIVVYDTDGTTVLNPSEYCTNEDGFPRGTVTSLDISEKAFVYVVVESASATAQGNYSLTITQTDGGLINPTFDQVAAITSGATLSPLPTTSLNGIPGTWTPALNNTATTIYTFTPSAAYTCALEAYMSITVNAAITAPTANAQTFCGSTTVASLEATGATGNTLIWYNVATGGTALASSTAITASGTYYVSQSDGTNESTRTSVAITISPNNTTTSTAVACGTYFWMESEQTYNVSGIYTSGFGCNLKTLLLTITMQPEQPIGLACYQTAVLNTTFCEWTITGTQPAQPTLACYQTATFNNDICAWEVTGTPPTQPTANAQSFCGSTTVASLAATATSGYTLNWYSAATGGTALASSTAITTSGTYYVSQSIGTCESTRTSVAVIINPIPPALGVLASAINLLPGSIIDDFTFYTDNLVSGATYGWYDSLTAVSGSYITDIETPLVSGTTYYISQIVNGCESPRTGMTVTLSTTPSAPITYEQSFCGNTTVGSLDAITFNGNGTVWYATATGGTALASSTPITTSGTYYAAQINGTMEGPRASSMVTVTNLSAPIASAQSFCGSTTVASLVATSSTGNTLNWYNSTGSLLASTTAISTSGTYYVSQTDGNCESPTTDVVVTITPNSDTTTIESACGIYTWAVNGTTYTTSGTYTYVSCGTKTLILTITPDTSTTSTVASCGSYFWIESEQTYTTSGTYTSGSGCSIKTLNLTITPSTTNSTTASACGSYTWSVNGTTYSTSGTYTSTTGCATEELVLTITPNTTNTTTASACDSYTWSVNGTTYTTSGTYTSTTGCATEELVLTITPSTTNSTTASACDSYIWAVNSTTYTTSGTYTSTSGCATEELVLTITPSTTNTTTASACGSYTWSVNGTTYFTSGTYTSVSGCTTEQLALTITPDTSTSLTESACGSYFWIESEQTYTTSGTYTSGSGCSIKSLNLTITPSTTNSTTASACGSYTWSVNGTTYSTSGTYTSTTGCATEELVLTITPNTTNTTTASACDSYTWSVNGTTYSTSGTYTAVSSCGTEELVLTITPSTTNSTTASACDSYIWAVNGTTYTESGTYTVVDGCDEQILALTILSPIDNTVTNNGTTLSANQTGATYQWIDCNNSNSAIVGETNQTFTPSASGSYAVVVSNGTCSVTSGCQTITVLATNQFDFNNSILATPNPFDTSFAIKNTIEGTITIYDAVGKTIRIEKLNIGTTSFDLSRYSSGIYLVKFNDSDNNSKLFKMIKR
ncbi:T9SS type A sorting domain-containing protein [Flavobacterium sp. SUN052]|uniref:T9SS type A sorting domain-containing protein n=1 Tax=Flavobacterium sp. SUN052 TaxID=3002441 RepID=UPI00237E99AA|nr:T9SS type A sorting domain-containing protein [Flavobacterium sp. SUN052]MEC4005905.1 T9SS type A sorting domain-containing protein [Flavobacterium sp. SUN052]